MLECDWAAFKEEARSFGTIGKAIIDLSNLEFAHDSLIMGFHERWPDQALAISKSFPLQFKDKTDFVVQAVIRTPLLRTMPISRDGDLDLVWLQYQLDELYDMRAVLAHGSNFYREKKYDYTTWYLDRYEKAGKGARRITKSQIGDGHLARISTTAKAMKIYFWNLHNLVSKHETWEKIYKTDIEVRENRRLLHDALSEISEAKNHSLSKLFAE